MICPKCQGTGVILLPTVSLRTQKPALLSCRQCYGKRIVPDEMKQWMMDGEALANYRRDSRLTLRQGARWLGMDVVLLSEMERGVAQPDLSISYLGLMILNKA